MVKKGDHNSQLCVVLMILLIKDNLRKLHTGYYRDSTYKYEGLLTKIIGIDLGQKNI